MDLGGKIPLLLLHTHTGPNTIIPYVFYNNCAQWSELDPDSEKTLKHVLIFKQKISSIELDRIIYVLKVKHLLTFFVRSGP